MTDRARFFLILSATSLLVLSLAVAASTAYGKFWTYVGILFLLTAIPAVLVTRQGLSPAVAFLIVPTLLVSFDTFFLRMGILNLFNFLTDGWFRNLSMEFLQKAMVLAALGNLLLWLGYFSPLARRLGERWSLKARAWTAGHDEPVMPLIWTVFLIGVGIRVYLVQSGIGGFFSDPQARAQALPYVQLLNLLDSLSSLSLVTYLAVLLREPAPRWRGLIIMLTLETVSVLLLGFKGQILYRFFWLAITYALVKREFPIRLVAAGFLILVLITPANLISRQRFLIGRFATGDILSIQKNLALGFAESYLGEGVTRSVGLAVNEILRNSAQLEIFALIVQHIDVTGDYLYGQDYLYPLFALIPRAIWPQKPLTHRGEWVNVEIYNNVYGSSTGQTVPGDFYLNGGSLAVLAGFFLMGLVQRALGSALLEVSSLRVLPLVPFLLFALGQPESDLGSQAAGVMVAALFNFLVLFFLVRKRPA